MKRICARCKKRPRKAHFNSKWCIQCAKDLVSRPAGNLSVAQKAFALQHRGDMKIDDICRKLNVSRANLKRSCRGMRFFSHNGKYKERPDLVRQVLDFYFENGKSATVEAFPNVNVKCIVDRPEYYGIKRVFRQKRWTPEDFHEAVKMAGLVSFKAQAIFFNRPRANAGSVKALWSKRMSSYPGYLHGLAAWNAKWIISEKCPVLRPKHAAGRDFNPKSETHPLVLYVDAEKYLRTDCPEFVRSAIGTMADFTRWVFDSKNPKRQIIKMIRERESFK